MADSPSRRSVSEVREQVIERLTQNYAHNNLDVEEFEERLSRATSAETVAELTLLVSDLPQLAEKRRSAPAGLEVAVNTGVVREEGVLLAIMGGSTRKGVWQPPRRLRIFAMMGGVELDFTQAEMPPGTTEVTVFTLMGGVDITVPPGMNVDVAGIPFMGGFDDKSAGMVDPHAPTLRIRGVAIMGGVDVKVPRRYRKMIDELRRSERRSGGNVEPR